jgi:hypothetical protein
MQRSLLSIPNKSRTHPKSRRNSRKLHLTKRGQAGYHRNGSILGPPSEPVQDIKLPPKVPAQLTRLVDLAVTVRYRSGQAQFETVAVLDPDFEAAGIETKLRMVQYLQDLRLLLWLLCRKQRSDPRLITPYSTHHSKLMSEAGLVSYWTIRMTLSMAAHSDEPQLNHSHVGSMLYLLQCVRESIGEEYLIDDLRISQLTTIVIDVIALCRALRPFKSLRSPRNPPLQFIRATYQMLSAGLLRLGEDRRILHPSC